MESIYGGSWQLFQNEKHFNGELHLDDEKKVIAIVIKVTDSPKMIPDFPYLGKIPYINGVISNGAKVLLYNCHTGKSYTKVGSYSQQIIYAEYGFWGLNINSADELQFKGARIDFGELLNWYNLCEFKFVPSKEDGDQKKHHSYQWESVAPVKISCNENLDITFTPVGGFGDGEKKREFVLKQNVLVDFDYKEDVSWETILNDVQSIQYLIGLGIRQPLEIESVKYNHRSIFESYPGMDEKPYYLDADVSLGTGKHEKLQEVNSAYCLFVLDNLLQLPEGLKKWFLSYEELKPIFDLLFLVRHGLGSPVTTFLSLTQALETYHSRFIVDDKEDYIKRVEKLISIYPDKSVQDHFSDFLFVGNKGKGNLVLQNRIADLLYAEGQFPVRGSKKLFDHFAEQVSDTRNYYTHYNEKKKDKIFKEEDIPAVNGYLVCILEYHLLLHIGFDQTFAKDAIEKAVRNLHIYERIQMESPKLEESNNKEEGNV